LYLFAYERLAAAVSACQDGHFVEVDAVSDVDYAFDSLFCILHAFVLLWHKDSMSCFNTACREKEIPDFLPGYFGRIDRQIRVIHKALGFGPTFL
jgi:hypothetical protein